MADRSTLTTLWANARREDGWLDLRGIVPGSHRPACGLGRCKALAAWLDPAGVGWCPVHVDCGLFDAPEAREVVRVAS